MHENLKPFQFYPSSIKSGKRTNLILIILMFQFYPSSIKRVIFFLEILLVIWFQFYPSSIKRRKPNQFQYSYYSFNSTLVQLKAGRRCCGVVKGSSFNSTLVQLKVDQNQQLDLMLKSFQFYPSSIKSRR